MATYNLLGGDFAVQFDLYTPRPHFIILPKKGRAINPKFSKMTDQQKWQLIWVAKSALLNFGIPVKSSSLSIHCGSWRSYRTGFHAHLCVELEPYLAVFHRHERDIPWYSWPRQDSKGKWKYKNGSYVDNVCAGYPYESPFDKEVAAIEQLKRKSSRVAGHSSTQPFIKGVVKQVIYHSTLPMIGFIGREKTVSIPEMSEVLGVMEEFAEAHSLTDMKSSDQDKGCHLVLYLDSDVAEGQGVRGLGYIVTTGPRFYQLCPDSDREKWFQAFRQSNFKCVT